MSKKMCKGQGSRNWDPWDPVGSDRTYLVGQREISTHSRLDTTHIRLEKLTADWKNGPADRGHCLEDWTNHITMNKFVNSDG